MSPGVSAPKRYLGECKLSNSELTPAYYAPVTIGGKSSVMLLDSGCTQSVFPRREFELLDPNSCTPLQPVAGRGVLANGSKIYLDGLSHITFRIGPHKVKHQFLIADINNTILLGLDFFESQQCQVDFQAAVLRIQNRVVTCCNQNGNPLKVNVQVKGKTVVPARSEVVRVARLGRQWTQGLACVETADKVPGVLVATSVQTPKEQAVHLRLMNYTDKEITIPAGKIVASCMSAAVCNHDVSKSPPNPKLSEAFQDMARDSCSNLSPHDRAKVEDLLTKHQAVFSQGKYDLGRTSLVQHNIPLLPGSRPLKQRPYRHGPAQEEEIEKQVKEMQQQGLIKEGHGAWSSPVVLVQKKDRSWRFCVDYRKLNATTHKDAYPLPRIDDSLDALGGSKLFSTLDLTSGYWQVELDVEAKEKAAFVTRSGLWEWQVLPFGLTSAPSTFERLMETVLRGLHWKTLLIYLDDIIVFSKDLDSHLERLGEVFTRLHQAGLKLRPDKCKLLATRVNYLGHVVSENGVETEEAKVLAVKEWPTPRHKKRCTCLLRDLWLLSAFHTQLRRRQ